MVYGYVIFKGGEKGLWSDNNRAGWFPYLKGMAEVSNVPAFERICTKMMKSGTRRVAGVYAEVTVSVCARSTPLSVAGVQRQLSDCCTKVDGPGRSDGYKDQSGSNAIPERFQLQFGATIASQVYVGGMTT